MQHFSIPEQLEQLEGLEALYNLFFKEFVVRRKNDLTNPTMHSLSDIELPRDSVLFYYPKHTNDLGPSNTEPLVANYPDVINIGFDSRYEILTGKARPAPLDERKQIQRYRNGHYKYRYARNLAQPMKRAKELVVINNALGQLKWNYVPTRFLAFDKSYNQLGSIFRVMNDHTSGNTRQFFMRIELPNQIPNFTKFVEYFKHYEKCFETDAQTGEVKFLGINDQAIRDLKRTGAYWLLDWFAWLTGKHQCSLFNELSADALERLNLVFTKNGKCVIMKPGLLKTWLDELNKVTEVNGVTTVDYQTSQRQNAVKRILTIFMRMVAQSELEVDSEDHTLDEGIDQVQKAKDSETEIQGEDEEIALVDSTDDDSSFSDLLSGRKVDLQRSEGSDDEERDGRSATGDIPQHEDDEIVQWTDDIDDTEFQVSESEVTLDHQRMVDENPSTGIKRAIQRLSKDGQLTKAQQEFFLRQSESYKDLTMPNGVTLEEFVKLDEKALRNLESKVAPEMLGVEDDSYLNSTVDHLRKGYVDRFLEQDIVRSILAVQQAGICLTNFEREEVHNVDGSYVIYKVGLHPVGGKQVTRNFRVAKINKDGTFTVDGKKRTKALQRMDLPIRKMDDYRVGLSSYYGRKLIVSRSKAVADDYGVWLAKEIRRNAKRGDFELHVGGRFTNEYKLPRTFTMLSRRFAGIDLPDMKLIFDVKEILKRDPELKAKLTPESTVVGFKGKQPLYLDNHGIVSTDKEVLGSIESILKVRTGKGPIEYAQANINGYRFPMGVVLSYYFGFDELLKVLKVEPRSVPGGTRAKLTEDEFAISCADETLVFNRRNPIEALVFGGMTKLNNLHSFNRYDMNDPGIWVTAIDNAKVKPTHFREMTNLFDMFVDPITLDELKRLGHATSFDYLLIEAVEMLLTEQSRHEVEIEEQRFIGYESFPGAVYHQLTQSARNYRAKGNDPRNTVDLNPEAVMMEACLLDTAVDMVQEVNPIHEVKESETVTFGGNNGRNDVSMVRRTRGQLPTYKGIISEAGKDSSKVGYVTYTTSNPKITDYRGNVDPNRDVGAAGLGSVTMNLMPGANKDDPKRLIRFSGVQCYD